jgi:hypothetical protein
MSDALNFDDLSPVEIPVKLSNKEYVLREASGDAAVKWRNAQVRAARMVDGKVSGVGDIADSEPLLVSLCMWEVTTVSGTRREVPVPLHVVRSWPARVVSTLFEKIKEISGLEGTETEETIRKRIAADSRKIREMRKAAVKTGVDSSNSDPTSH